MLSYPSFHPSFILSTSFLPFSLTSCAPSLSLLPPLFSIMTMYRHKMSTGRVERRWQLQASSKHFMHESVHTVPHTSSTEVHCTTHKFNLFSTFQEDKSTCDWFLQCICLWWGSWRWKGRVREGRVGLRIAEQRSHDLKYYDMTRYTVHDTTRCIHTRHIISPQASITTATATAHKAPSQYWIQVQGCVV